MKFALIDEKKTHHSVSRLASVLSSSRFLLRLEEEGCTGAKNP